jgi:tRNA A-37 threonylcarbamoyl transferase component Bud32
VLALGASLWVLGFCRQEAGTHSSLSVCAVLVVTFCSFFALPFFIYSWLFLLTVVFLIFMLLVLLGLSLTQANEKQQFLLCSQIKCSDAGISFAWLGKKTVATSVVLWVGVKNLTVHSLQLNKKYSSSGDPTASAMLVLDIEKAVIEDFPRFLGMVSCFASDWQLLDGRLQKLVAGQLRIHMPLAALSLESERAIFVEHLLQHAPSSQGSEIKNLLDPNQGAGFTRLWLEEANLSRRRNLEELIPGHILQDGRYAIIIIAKIAAGGQATVYKGQERESESRLVASKEFVLPEGGGMATRSRSLESVKREAMMLASFVHPAIAKLLDNFIEDNRAYLCFEFISGRSLRNLVQEDGPLGAEETLTIARKLADILAYLHGLSPPVVHRDLSPDNLMLDPYGRLVLIDFNVAEQLESSDTKTVVGKHHYMAPEEFKG